MSADADAERFWRIVSRAYYTLTDVGRQFELLDRMATPLSLTRGQILLKLRAAYDHQQNSEEEMAWALRYLRS